MNNQNQLPNAAVSKPDYEPPMVRMMNEAEVLSAFQVTAAGTSTWWNM